MDCASLEGLAVAVYERHDLDPREPVSTITLANLILGPNSVVRPSWMTSAASLYKQDGVQKIAIRRGLPIEYTLFYCGHELAHVLLANEDRGADLEASCDYLAGALMAPRPAMRQLRFAFGDDYAEIADAVCSTQSWAALRLAEVTGQPTALVAPRRVRVRGDEWGWPSSEDQIRAIAKASKIPGLHSTRLTDDRRRIVLRADTAA